MRIFGRVRQRPSSDWRLATDRAFTLIDDGRYEDAGALLTRAADLEPWLSESWFNLALLYKFRHDWEQARAAGLRAVALLEKDAGAPDWWNVGIAATALQDWPLARRAWQAYGLPVPDGGSAAGGEPLGMDLGGAAVRLSPEGEAEVVWGRRLDPARIEVQNIPLPSSGRRWGEVVLHDGVPRGERTMTAGGVTSVYPVFDEIELWAPSAVPTWVVLIEAATEADRDALERLAADAGYAAEDWSSSVRLLCRACSESRMPSEQGDGLAQHDPHDHSVPGRPGPLGHTGAGALWSPERECGLAAPEQLVRGLLDGWVADSEDTRDWRDLEEVC
ncbi:tetratricopeptide repeat protein [Streptomyces sp. 8K308]|uniref:tetratricopeptide repeat protein n=1 Tax=Streptomyces sp. 8K308 TaxID=2530388 RepID=UPI0010497DB3|nr:tetratricopeptide repeat protein [Streptomyces sp. 8K308]TDC19963.1 tetratricopeptide repeat protein [Streptomyces sp. 8K308]